MSGDTLSGGELVEIRLIELKTIVSPEFLYLSPSLVLYKGFEFLEHRKSLIFLLQKINPYSLRKIMYEGQHITFSSNRRNSRWIPQVRMYIIKGTFSTVSSRRKADSLLFSKNTMIVEIKFFRTFVAK